MIARLYSNENFPLPVVIALRALGHDVLTSFDAGKANDAIPDDEVLRYATADQRAVITHNRQDFIRLHRHQPNHAGIIWHTQGGGKTALAFYNVRFLTDWFQKLGTVPKSDARLHRPRSRHRPRHFGRRHHRWHGRL